MTAFSTLSKLALAAAAASLLTLTACTNLPATTPQTAVAGNGATLLATADAVIRQATPGHVVNAALAATEVVIGSPVALRLRAAQAGYVYVYQLSADGKAVDLVFPNAMDGSNYLPSGDLTLPRGNWALKSHGPAGTGYFVTVVTDKQQDLMEISKQAQVGKIVIDGAYGASLNSIREVSQ